MKLKPNISYKYFLHSLIISFVFSSCENSYKYQKIKIDSKHKKIEILSDEFVFDSIIIENNNETFFNAYLLNKKKGTNVFYLSKNNENNYHLIKNKFDEMCYGKNDNSMKNFDIFIRNKNYYGSNKFQDRENIQRFNISYFPCNDDFIIVDALGVH